MKVHRNVNDGRQSITQLDNCLQLPQKILMVLYIKFLMSKIIFF